MFILALLLPFLGFLIATGLGRWTGKKGAALMSSLFMVLTVIVNLYIWNYVFLGKSEVWLHLYNWIAIDFIHIPIDLVFDSITANMLVVVTSISALVHIYSVSYMKEDPVKCFGKALNKWDKLSNSGDTLKLIIPNHGIKAVSGWSNYPCTVTSYKIGENQMGYRGSKSEKVFWLVFLLILPSFLVVSFVAGYRPELTITNILDFSDETYITTAVAMFYSNADKEKIKILLDNQEKSGIYRWTNKKTGKCYIGSSTNLRNRLRNYYNINYLLRTKGIINDALLKYGYGDFSLEILEYCDPAKCFSREQYYMDRHNPEYNILKRAGSFTGYTHKIEAIAKIRHHLMGNKHAVNAKGRKRAEGAGSPSVPISVFDQKTGESKAFNSIFDE